jgi:hypothetical protein
MRLATPAEPNNHMRKDKVNLAVSDTPNSLNKLEESIADYGKECLIKRGLYFAQFSQKYSSAEPATNDY